MVEAVTFRTQFIKGFSWRLFSKLFSLVATLFLGRYLRAVDYGELVFIFNLLTFGPALSSLGFYEVLLRRKYTSNLEISSVLNIVLIVNFLFYFLLVCLIKYNFLDVGNKELYCVTLFALPLSSIQFYYNHQLFLRNDSMKLSSFQSLGAVVGAIAALILAKYGFGIWALSAQVLTSIVTILIFSMISCKILPILKINWIFLRENLREALKYLQNLIIKNIVNRVDRLIISYFFTKEIVGLYDFASKFAFNLLQLLQVNLVQLYRSYFYQIYHQEKNSELELAKVQVVTKKLFSRMLKFIMPMFIGLGFFAKEYLEFIYNGKWNKAEIFVMFLSLTAVIRLFTDFYQTWLTFLGEVKISKSSMIKSLSLSFISAPLLIFFPRIEFLFILLLLPLILENYLFSRNFYNFTKQKIQLEIIVYSLFITLIFILKYYYPAKLLYTGAVLLLIFAIHFLFCFKLEKKIMSATKSLGT